MKYHLRDVAAFAMVSYLFGKTELSGHFVGRLVQESLFDDFLEPKSNKN
jgi:hypothetical protein